MSWPSLLVTFGSLFALACGSSTDPTPIGQPKELAPGQSTQVESLRVTFTGVSSDSRCPVDVVCVWAGDAVAKVELSQPTGGVESHELHTTLTPQSVTYGGFKVELVRLDPAPRSTQSIPAERYRLVVRVTSAS